MDIYQREGHYPLPPGAPETLGVEFSGTITEVGEGCKPLWKVGDEVLGLASGVSSFPSQNAPVSRAVGGVCRVHSRTANQSHAEAQTPLLGRGG